MSELACEGTAPGRAARAGVAPVPALAFRDVSFSYGQAAEPVLDRFSLIVSTGRVTGIVGPNGCGKSTLLKLADGLLRPREGLVSVCGRDVSRLPSRERARLVALLPQVHRTPSMTVRDLVMCGRYARMGAFGRAAERDRAAVDEAMREMGIERLAGKPARSLSGGERQRAFLAMAVAQEAEVLLLDEPTTYLDARAAHETMSLAHELNRSRGIAVVAVIHDLDLALRSCDELVVLDGRGEGPLAQGPAADASVLGAMERAFGVRVVPVDTPCGRAFATFPR